MTPSLGIAVPSFEQPRFVADAIRSVKGLTVPFEAIIQDGGSSARTLELITGAIGDDRRFRLVVADDEGQSDAINRAWAQLLERHPYLTWLNTDDIMYPAGIEALVDGLEQDASMAVAYGDLDAIDEAGDLVGWSRAPDRVRRYRLVYHHNLVPGICPVVRSAAIRQVGMLDVGLHYAMDHDLFVRLAEVGTLRRVPVRVAGYRTYADAKTWGHKAAAEQEIAEVRARYRRIPAPAAVLVRALLRLAWLPTHRRYTEGVMRRRNRDFGVRGARLL